MDRRTARPSYSRNAGYCAITTICSPAMHRHPARSKDWRRISLILRVAGGTIGHAPKPRGCARSGMYASIFREGIFDGRTIVITGGGSGIGRCTAHELASLGAKVLV